MEIQVLYTIDYQLPISVSWEKVSKWCEDNNIKMEKTNINRIAKFYGSNEHNLLMLQYHCNLKSIK